jgi:hypothetical protein
MQQLLRGLNVFFCYKKTHLLRVYRGRLVRRILGPKEEEEDVTF